ncbi:DNA repair protein complementing XP-G cells [Harpegnathos saltator]|uniref:DNA-repair protein complementing XP-G cells n=1 Tax=Harpegnathos saltator TaxID=610380 RepID=E2BI58_HARSA|nr:DNA repair protein complementing XP-G cells [Harpegnathos saltator]EFN84629.1 DNA-repair protein complementing XP-G cells [Harpegnathos saltator]
MGVYGLWRLLDASGKPVVLENLEGKVLAIDVSIWIYQVLQGYQNQHGASKPNAHLLGLYTRICKLLYYRIKPVFVFDGGVPMLKKNTIASRRKQKSIATSKAQKMKADLINNLIKHSVVKTVLNKDSKVDQINGTTQITINLQGKHAEPDMFALPDMPSTSGLQTFVNDEEYDSDASVELSPRKQSKWMGNIHNVDVTTGEFKALPADVRYDILTDLRETRKQNSWGRLHEMPEESQEFSGFQMKRLLKRRYVQQSLESAEKEMGGKTLTLEELDKLLTEQGINTKGRDIAFRIAADDTTRLIYISDKNALARSSTEGKAGTDKNDSPPNETEEVEPVAGPSNPTPIVENMNEYELNDDSDDDIAPIYDDPLPIAEDVNEYTFDSDVEPGTNEPDVNESLPLSKKYFSKNTRNPALTYMLEYSGLTQNQIMHLINHNDESHKTRSKSVKTPEKDARSSELEESRSPTDDKPASFNPVEDHEDRSKAVELQDTQDARSAKDNSAVELIPSNPESDNFIEVEPFEDHETSGFTAASHATSSSNEVIPERCSIAESDDVTKIDTSDSDTDDFIEIHDVPIPDVDVSSGSVKKGNIEITIRSDEKLEDDMFADIFGKVDRNEAGPTSCAKEIAPVGANDEPRTVLVPAETVKDGNNTRQLDTIPEEPEEAVTEKTDVESPENGQSIENVSNNESRTCDSRSPDKLADQGNTNSEVDPSNKHVQENPVVLPTNEEGWVELKDQLEDEQEELTRNIGKLERQATNISEQIRIEAQELLRLFGIPYVVAPMEAEAQCAYLEQIKLTDGTITDDSDIWLFGGRCVYKNFFNNSKRVQQFRACDIQHHFKLTRNQLIQLALLVGSDYTTGVAGIGPVTALEILAAFPAEGDNVLHGLHNFCTWIKKGKIAAPGKTGLRNKLRNVKLDKDFPSQAVVQAYLFPTIDESKETFTWGKPNAVLLCDYTRQKFGWTKGKFDDTMIPVLRRMEERKSQKILDLYFKLMVSPKSVEPSLSKRVQKALYKMNNESNVIEENTDGETQAKKSKKSNADQKMKKEKIIKPSIATHEPEALVEVDAALKRPIVPNVHDRSVKEYIPQRERDKASSLEKKLHAIEVFRKSRKGLVKTKKVKRTVRKVKKEAELSESDSN